MPAMDVTIGFDGFCHSRQSDSSSLGSRGEDIAHAVQVLHDPRDLVLQVCDMVCCYGFLTLLLPTETLSSEAAESVFLRRYISRMELDVRAA